mmetsp:Transcript_9808/g.20792  ORF Transcript_9808/g.20792 Transcript_9808/m.20792 type:complete len:279 (-) Transcript_9808:41-877(-)
MKVTLKYEEGGEADLHMTLRLTLPQKYVNGPTKDVVKLFVDHYNKKHPESVLDCEALHLKIVGGDHLEGPMKVRDCMGHGDECYLLGATSVAGPTTKRTAPTPSVDAPGKQSATEAPSKSGKDADGRVRCKRFGCQQMFNPDGPEQKCVYHKSPPIFHETAKWWSCCPDKKAYEFEEFMRIPGCQVGICTNCPDGKPDQKRFLGGCDLRADSAPVRLDANAPKDPRIKIAEMMAGLVAIGVDKALFEKVWAKLAAQHTDLEKVVEIMKNVFTSTLNKA